MYLNKFSVRVVGGAEDGGYVAVCEGPYALVLRNGRDTRCDAAVEIDGQPAGTWRILAGKSIRIEHPQNDDGAFMFRSPGPRDTSPNYGLVKVTFSPEKAGVEANEGYTTSVAPGGAQNQFSIKAGGLDVDAGRVTVIHLRLVERGICELPAVAFSTPVPPRV